MMIQQIKQSTVKCLHDADGGDKKIYKRKRKKGARCKEHKGPSSSRVGRRLRKIDGSFGVRRLLKF